MSKERRGMPNLGREQICPPSPFCLIQTLNKLGNALSIIEGNHLHSVYRLNMQLSETPSQTYVSPIFVSPPELKYNIFIMVDNSLK